MKVTVIPIVTGALGTVTKEFVQGVEALERRSGDHPNHSIMEIGREYKEKSWRLGVSQTPVESYELTLEEKKLSKE